MRKRTGDTKTFTRTQPPYWDGVETREKRISSSNFSLSYNLSTTDDYPLPKKLIPTVSPSNDSFWTNWYLSHLKKLQIPTHKDINVHVYWKGDHLRCNWSAKSRFRPYLKHLNLYFEDYDGLIDHNYLYIRGPELISDTTTSLTVSTIPSTRPQSKEKLNRFRGSHLILTYSKLPQCFVDSLFTNETGNNKTSEEVKHFFKSSHGWDESLLVNIHSCIISREIHKDGTPHIHFYCYIPNLPRSINVHSFDIWTGSDWSHPNIQSNKSAPTHGINYVVKDGDFIADPWILIEEISTGVYKYFTTDIYVRYVAETVGIEEAKSFYKSYDPDNYYKNWAKILPELQTLRSAELSKLIDSRQSPFDKNGPEFPILQNNYNYNILFGWLNHLNYIKDWWGNSFQDTIPCSLILLGPANIGKGEFIRAHLRKFIAEGTVVWAQSKDDLSRVTPYLTKIVVLDDLSWRVKGVFGETESSASRLLSTIDDRSIERRYRPESYFLPERTVTIIISNPNKLPNFMGGDLNTENSRKLTNKEEAYIIANPDLYLKRIDCEDSNNPNPKAARYKPYKLEDLPPEKHIEAGYCDEPDLHYVPLDIHPKRTHILRFGPEDILFDPTKTSETKRRSYDTSSLDSEKYDYLKALHDHGFLKPWKTFPPKHVDLDAIYKLNGPHTTWGNEFQKRLLKLKSKEQKPIKQPSPYDNECTVWDINPKK